MGHFFFYSCLLSEKEEQSNSSVVLFMFLKDTKSLLLGLSNVFPQIEQHKATIHSKIETNQPYYVAEAVQSNRYNGDSI